MLNKVEPQTAGSEKSALFARPLGELLDWRIAVVFLGCVVSLAIFFRFQIENGFTLLFSDRLDGFIELSLLEHWNNVFHRVETWDRPLYLFPELHALGYNDGYLALGILHTIFRTLGVDVFLSGELVNISLRALGYFSFYAASRRLLKLSWGWSVFAAILFTDSVGIFNQMVHAQLATVSFAPALALMINRFHGALIGDKRRPVLLWGLAFVTSYAVWLATAFYMAWYFAFFTCAFSFAWAIQAGEGRLGALWAGVVRHRWVVLALLAIAGAENKPFAELYLSKAGETGGRLYIESRNFLLTPADAVHVGSGSLFYGDWDMQLRDYFDVSSGGNSEWTTGFPWLLLALFLAAIVWLWRRQPNNDETIKLRALAGAALVTWLLFMKFTDDYTAFSIVYGLVPGAKAMRVLMRYQLFLAGPVIGIAILFLARYSARIPRVLLVVFCGLLLAEEINNLPPAALQRTEELDRMARIPKPPAECKVFYVSKTRPGHFENEVVEGFYSHNSDSMLIAELFHIPTINGMASFLPPGYDLFYPQRDSYSEKIKFYALRNQIGWLCALDLTAMTWTPYTPS